MTGGTVAYSVATVQKNVQTEMISTAGAGDAGSIDTRHQNFGAAWRVRKIGVSGGDEHVAALKRMTASHVT
jgi:hypothetical protein